MQNPRVIYLYEAFTAAVIGAIAYEVQPDGSAVKVALSSIAPEDRKGVWVDLPPFTEGPGAGKPRRRRVFSKRRTAEVALAKLPDSKVFVPILKGAGLLETNLAVFQHLAFLKENVDAALASKKKYAGRHPGAGWDVYMAIDNRLQQIRFKLAEQHERATIDTTKVELHHGISPSTRLLHLCSWCLCGHHMWHPLARGHQVGVELGHPC